MDDNDDRVSVEVCDMLLVICCCTLQDNELKTCMEHLLVCLLTHYRFSVVDCELTLQVCWLVIYCLCRQSSAIASVCAFIFHYMSS